MENFDWTSFTKRIAIRAKRADLYNAWTKAAGIEKWFLREAGFFDADKRPVDKHASVQKGYRYTWTWYLYEDPMHGVIQEANGKDFIRFTFEGECLVEVKLTEQGDYVILELTHKNIPTDDHSRQFIRLGCASGWAFYLVNLKSVCEGGLDLRNKDPRLSPMINN